MGRGTIGIDAYPVIGYPYPTCVFIGLHVTRISRVPYLTEAYFIFFSKMYIIINIEG